MRKIKRDSSQFKIISLKQPEPQLNQNPIKTYESMSTNKLPKDIQEFVNNIAANGF